MSELIWEAPDVKEWKSKAIREQNYYCTLLENREYDLIKDNTILRMKVGYAVFGPPTKIPEKDDLFNVGYGPEQMKIIENISGKIEERSKLYKGSDHIQFGVAFLLCKNYDERFREAVFRVKSGPSSFEFIDSSSRVYSNWEHFLTENTLKKCLFCCPSQSFYQRKDGKVQVDFAKSPACNLISKVASAIDLTTELVSFGVTAATVAAIFLPTTPLVLSAAVGAEITAGVYELTRHAYNLVDRSKHDQSISLIDPEAKDIWLSIIEEGLGFAANGASHLATRMAKSGVLLREASHITARFLEVDSTMVTEIVRINGMQKFIEKTQKNDLTPLDVFQFTSAVLFFTKDLAELQSSG